LPTVSKDIKTALNYTKEKETEGPSEATTVKQPAAKKESIVSEEPVVTTPISTVSQSVSNLSSIPSDVDKVSTIGSVRSIDKLITSTTEKSILSTETTSTLASTSQTSTTLTMGPRLESMGKY